MNQENEEEGEEEEEGENDEEDNNSLIPWGCIKCTFENLPSRNSCEVCEEPRPSTGRAH